MTVNQLKIGDRITYDFTQHVREVVKVWSDGDEDGFTTLTTKNPDGSMYVTQHHSNLMPGNIALVSRDGSVVYEKRGVGR